jgi:transposase
LFQNKEFELHFQDEARFGRISVPKRCWAPKPIRPECNEQIVREYTYAYCSVNPKNGYTDFLMLPRMDTACMEIFLHSVSNTHKDSYIMMVMDGAPCHHAKKLKCPKNIQLIFLPPYSPQLNPVENLWEEIREKYFPNLTFDSMDALEDHLCSSLKDFHTKTDTIKSISQFHWIKSSLYL